MREHSRMFPFTFLELFNRSMIIYKTKEQIELIREAAQVVSRTLGKVAEAIEPGISTLELDAIAESYIRSQNAIPGFLRSEEHTSELQSRPQFVGRLLL